MTAVMGTGQGHILANSAPTYGSRAHIISLIEEGCKGLSDNEVQNVIGTYKRAGGTLDGTLLTKAVLSCNWEVFVALMKAGSPVESLSEETLLSFLQEDFSGDATLAANIYLQLAIKIPGLLTRALLDGRSLAERFVKGEGNLEVCNKTLSLAMDKCDLAKPDKTGRPLIEYLLDRFDSTQGDRLPLATAMLNSGLERFYNARFNSKNTAT